MKGRHPNSFARAGGKAVAQAMRKATSRYDLLIEPRGSLVMVRPMSDAARRWIEENVAGDDLQWFAGALAVEPRYIEHLTAGMLDAGLILRMWG